MQVGSHLPRRNGEGESASCTDCPCLPLWSRLRAASPALQAEGATRGSRECPASLIQDILSPHWQLPLPLYETDKVVRKDSLLNLGPRGQSFWEASAPPAPRPFQSQGWGSRTSQEVALQPLGSQGGQEGSSHLPVKWQPGGVDQPAAGCLRPSWERTPASYWSVSHNPP